LDLSELTDLSLVSLRIGARAREPLELPEWSGSTLRGAFGDALYDLVCAHRERAACADCPVEALCAFPYLFETRAQPGQVGTSGFRDLPRPYVIRSPLGRDMIAADQEFEWQVTLVGRAIQHLPYFVLAWRAMGETGLGRRGGRFELARVEVLDGDGVPVATVYDRETSRLTPPSENLIVSPAYPAPTGALEVMFLTPTSLKAEGQPVRRPEFALFWKAVQLRLSLLRLAHGAGRPAVDFRESLRQAEVVRLVEWEAQELSWERYSRRQGQRVPMRGFVGTARYQGDVTPFLPALRLGSLVGVGDNCTFGQGQFAVVERGKSGGERGG
jgi:hypothetical protein